jgi:hypothetical protein
MRSAGEEVASCLMNATIAKSMGGLGGCRRYDIDDYPEEFREIITAYVEQKIVSVEAIYLAMEKAKKGS